MSHHAVRARRSWIVRALTASGVALVLLVLTWELSADPERATPAVARLHGIDLDGRIHRFAADDEKRAVVVVFLSTDCPISNGYLPELGRLARRFRREADVYGVVSSSYTSRAAALAHREKFAPTFPVLFDASGALRRQLRPARTPEAFVLGTDGCVVYSGAIDDRYAEVGRPKVRADRRYLNDAIEAVVAGRRVEVARTRSVGCLVERPPVAEPSTDVTYSRDIAPILRAHCANCHRPGQRAPFALLTYDDARRHARQIVEVTRSGLMPPWKPARGHVEFRNERGLSDREKHLLAVWEKNGKPEGKREDALPKPEFVDGWKLGKPDVVLEMSEAFEVPADGPDRWQLFVFPDVADSDRLIAAVEFLPGSPEVVHHASFFVDGKRQGRRLAAAEPDYGYRGPGGGPLFPPNGVLRSWFPGANPHPLPDGMGRPLPKGSDLVVEIHYHPVGRVVTDRSKVGIHFAKAPARQLVEELQVMNVDLHIPANAPAHRHRASMTVPVDITLLDTSPHMHLLGKSVSARAVRPDGTVVPLLRVDVWDFNWQGHYVFREPIDLPAGSRIDVEFVYDNSRGNAQNPHSPPRPVDWGLGTNDEMGICHFQYTCKSLPDFFRMIRFHERHVVRQIEAYEGRAQRGLR